MSFREEIQLLQKEKPLIQQEKAKRIEAEQFKQSVLQMDEEAILKLYELYKNNLRRNCQEGSLFADHPGLGYLMIDSVPIPYEVKQKIKLYFKNDGFKAKQGFRGRYLEGFYLSYL